MYPLNPRFPYRKPPMLSKVSSPMVGRRLQEQFQDQLERLEASVDDGNFILDSENCTSMKMKDMKVVHDPWLLGGCMIRNLVLWAGDILWYPQINHYKFTKQR